MEIPLVAIRSTASPCNRVPPRSSLAGEPYLDDRLPVLKRENVLNVVFEGWAANKPLSFPGTLPVGSLWLLALSESGKISIELVGVRLEEDENHYAGDGNVEPNGEGEARDSAVHGEAAGQREKEGGQYHRQSHNGKDDVAG